LFFHLRYSPLPELYRNHFGHVATEAVDFLRRPEQQDIQHLVPCVGNGKEVRLSAVEKVYAIIELNGIIPVVDAGTGVEPVVARSFGRKFAVRLRHTGVHIELAVESGAGDVIEIVVWTECPAGIVICSEPAGSGRLSVRVILSRNMVRYEIHQGFQPAAMCTGNEFFELFHAFRYVVGQIGINIIIVFDGIRRSGFSFHYGRVVGTYAIFAIIRPGGMFRDTGIPDMGCAEFFDFFQCLHCEVGQLAATVFLQAAVVNAMIVVITEEAGEYLIYDDFVPVVHIAIAFSSRLLWYAASMMRITPDTWRASVAKGLPDRRCS
jgi:hypothetical protein